MPPSAPTALTQTTTSAPSHAADTSAPPATASTLLSSNDTNLTSPRGTESLMMDTARSSGERQSMTQIFFSSLVIESTRLTPIHLHLAWLGNCVTYAPNLGGRSSAGSGSTASPSAAKSLCTAASN